MPLDPIISAAPLALDANALAGQSDVRVAALTGGQLVAAWIDASDELDAESGSDIFVSIASAGGAPGTAVLANTAFTAGDQDSVALAAAADGGFYIGYVDAGPAGTASNLVVQRHAADGTLVSTATLQTSSSLVSFSDLSLAADPVNGGVIAGWRRIEGSAASARYVALTADLGLQPGEPAEGRVARSGSTALTEPMAALGADGIYRLALMQPYFGEDGVIFVRTDPVDGSPIALITDTHFDGLPSETPRIAPLVGEGAAGSWITVEGGEGKLGTVMITEGSSGWYYERGLSGHDLRAADVVGLPDGGAYFVVWDATDGVMRGFRRAGLTDVVGTEFQELFAVSGTVDEIDLTLTAEGEVQVVWSGSDGVFAATLDTRLGGEDWAWASALTFTDLGQSPAEQTYEGTGTFTIRNDIADEDGLSLYLWDVQLAGFDTLAFAPWPHSPADFDSYGYAGVTLHMHYLHFDQTGVPASEGLAGPLAADLTFDLTQLGDVDLSLDIVGADNGFAGEVRTHDRLDMSGWTFLLAPGGEVRSHVAVHEGATVIGADIDATFRIIGPDADVTGGEFIDYFEVVDTGPYGGPGGVMDAGALRIDGRGGPFNVLSLTSYSATERVFDLRAAEIVNVDRLGLETEGSLRVQVNFDAVDAPTEIFFYDASFGSAPAPVIELHASGDADLTTGGWTAADQSRDEVLFELHGSERSQDLRLNIGDAAVFAGGGSDDIHLLPPTPAAASGFAALLAPATQFVDGGTGYDAITLERGIAEFSVARSASGFTLTAADLVLELENVEAVRFTDGEVFLDPDDLLRLNWDSPQKYDPTQDFGTSWVYPGTNALKLGGNDWAALEVHKTVTENTVLRFYATFGPEAEVVGIGFDNDLNLSVNRFFTLLGRDAPLGDTTFDGITSPERSSYYEIPVGAFFTGEFDYLIFGNDDDAWTEFQPVPTSRYQNITFFERAPVQADGSAAALSSWGTYSGSSAEVTGDGTGVTVKSASATALHLSRTLGAGDWLRFTVEGDVTDRASSVTGRRASVLLDDDLNHNGVLATIELDAQTAADGARDYMVHIGAQHTGAFDYLAIANHYANAFEASTAFTVSDIEILRAGEAGQVLGDASLMVNGAWTVLESYGGTQDRVAASVLEDASGFTLYGNSWKAMEVDATVGRDTWLIFEMEAEDFGEVTAIGFDNDLSPSQETVFQLGGTDRYGSQFYRTYDAGDGKVRVEIHAGAFYQGDFRYLVALADDDADASAEVTFSNIEIVERETIDVSGIPRTLVSYGGTQDHGVAVVSPDGNEVMLGSNAWKAAVVDAEVSWETWLSFYFYTDLPVEVAGIGFDDDLSPSQAGFFQIEGSEVYGNQDFHRYDVGDGWWRYDIQVGARMAAGSYKYLTLLADDDAWPVGRAYFRDIALRQEETTWVKVNGVLTPMLYEYGKGQDHGTATPSADATALTLTDNAWKAIARETMIDEGTWLSVVVDITENAEAISIGFDFGDRPHNQTVWQLAGVHRWGHQEHNDLEAGDGPVHKLIHVGSRLAGLYESIALIADDDDPSDGVGTVTFSDIEILQAAEGVYESYGTPPTGLVQELDGASGVRLSGNANRLVDAAVEVDANTILHFEFKSYEEGEVHGIGLETDASISGGLFWQLLGTQEAGRQTHAGVYAVGDGWVAFDIEVGAEIAAGLYTSVSLLADSDGPGAPGDSWFRNVWFENVGAADEDVMIL